MEDVKSSDHLESGPRLSAHENVKAIHAESDECELVQRQESRTAPVQKKEHESPQNITDPRASEPSENNDSKQSEVESTTANNELAEASREAVPPLSPTYWSQILTQLKLKGVINSTLINAVIDRVERTEQGQALSLIVDAKKSSLMTASDSAVLSKALSKLYGSPIRVAIRSGELAPTQQTPAMLAACAHQNALVDAEKAFRNDPVVQSLERELGAVLVSSAIELADKKTAAK